MNRIIQVVPYFPPSISGVGDYALLLARELRRQHDIQTEFVVCDPNWNNAEPGIARLGQETSDGFVIWRLQARSAEGLERLLSQPGMPRMLLVQYVGYGYQKRGCPFWMLRGLKKWRKRCAAAAGLADRRLATMFHELYASGPIWASSFWTSALQRRLAGDLARLSDHCQTNRRLSADELERQAPKHAGAVRVVPVFSNFGEPSELLPLRERPPQAIMFGGFGRVIRNHANGLELLAKCCRLMGIQRLVTVGRSAAIQAPEWQGVAVENRKTISHQEAGQILPLCRVGFLDYFDGYLAKSGVFAAYCSHGLVPILMADNSSEPDDLVAGAHFLVAAALQEPISGSRQQAVADAARKWYAPHSLPRTAEAVAERLSIPAVLC